VQFRHETETSVPARLIGDAAALEQALWKIVENGIRFTDDGEVSVKLSVENASGPNVCLRVSVRDTGIGISHELKSKLFRSFTQADGSNARAHEGLGLGLAIVKHLVTALRGDLGFESEPGTGTTFWIVLPLQKSLDPALPTGLSA
jgi:signal transduction histidine kinase